MKETEIPKRQYKHLTSILTDGEMRILRFINDFGFCENQHIMKRFSLKRSACYLQMHLLIRLGLIVHVFKVPNRPGIYFLTQRGVQFSNHDLSPMPNIPMNTYFHHLSVINLYLKLRESEPNMDWITERRLLRDQYNGMAEKIKHLPDGVLVFPDDSRIAIEVEISLKGRDRLDDILTNYAVQSVFKEVWYFCSKQIISVVRKAAVGLNKIKIHQLDEV